MNAAIDVRLGGHVHDERRDASAKNGCDDPRFANISSHEFETACRLASLKGFDVPRVSKGINDYDEIFTPRFEQMAHEIGADETSSARNDPHAHSALSHLMRPSRRMQTAVNTVAHRRADIQAPMCKIGRARPGAVESGVLADGARLAWFGTGL